jgi:hypothetical protein
MRETSPMNKQKETKNGKQAFNKQFLNRLTRIKVKKV